MRGGSNNGPAPQWPQTAQEALFQVGQLSGHKAGMYPWARKEISIGFKNERSQHRDLRMRLGSD
jgi:hypothetical protein